MKKGGSSEPLKNHVIATVKGTHAGSIAIASMSAIIFS